MLRGTPIVMVILILLMFWTSPSEARVLCDLKDPIAMNQTLDYYFPIYLGNLTISIQLLEEIEEFRKETGAGLELLLAKAKTLRKEKYDRKNKELYSSFGVSVNDYTKFLVECLQKQNDEVKLYLNARPKIKSKLKEITPDNLLLVEVMSPDAINAKVIRKFLPIFIEESEQARETIKKTKELRQMMREDPKRARRLRFQLLQEGSQRREDFLRKHGVTGLELNKWRRPILESPLTQNYLEEHPALKARFKRSFPSTPTCQDDPSQAECEKGITSDDSSIGQAIDVPEVTLDMVKKFLPVIIEDGLQGLEEKKKLVEIETLAETDPKKANKLKRQLRQENILERKERLRKAGITSEEVRKLRILILQSPLANEYLDQHPEMRKRYGMIARHVEPLK